MDLNNMFLLQIQSVLKQKKKALQQTLYAHLQWELFCNHSAK